MKAIRLSNRRPLLDGMRGHNYALPDCLQYLFERAGAFGDLDFWAFAALTGDTVAQVYNRAETTRCGYCVSGYLAGRAYIEDIFGVLGYACEYWDADRITRDPDGCAAKIEACLSDGLPALAQTNIRDIPGWDSDVGTHCLVVGCGGRALSLLTEGVEPISYDLSLGKIDLIFPGGRTRAVSAVDVRRESVRRMRTYLTLPARDSMAFGAAAFRAWASDVEAGRFAAEGIDLWGNYGVYVCNLATNGDGVASVVRGLAAAVPERADLPAFADRLWTLLPTERPTGGRNLFWIRLDELGAGMDMDAVRGTMRDKTKRARVAAEMRAYATRADEATALLSTLAL